jgi:hypothetical protein
MIVKDLEFVDTCSSNNFFFQGLLVGAMGCGGKLVCAEGDFSFD